MVMILIFFARSKSEIQLISFLRDVVEKRATLREDARDLKLNLNQLTCCHKIFVQDCRNLWSSQYSSAPQIRNYGNGQLFWLFWNFLHASNFLVNDDILHDICLISNLSWKSSTFKMTIFFHVTTYCSHPVKAAHSSI